MPRMACRRWCGTSCRVHLSRRVVAAMPSMPAASGMLNVVSSASPVMLWTVPTLAAGAVAASERPGTLLRCRAVGSGLGGYLVALVPRVDEGQVGVDRVGLIQTAVLGGSQDRV